MTPDESIMPNDEPASGAHSDLQRRRQDVMAVLAESPAAEINARLTGLFAD
jgi:hypothetical protein